MFSKFPRWVRAATVVLSAVSAVPAFAQDNFPSKPVTLIVNFPAGGVTDGTFRRMSEQFKTLTGQSLIIDNKPGRGIATNAIYHAKPDGYTLGIVGRTQMSLYEQLNGKLPYHPVNDFTWVANITSSYFGVYTSAQSPYKSLQDVIDAAKAKPGALRYGTSFGQGGLAHVPMEDFSRLAGIEMQHVPFKGDTDALLLLSQNEIDLTVAGGGSANPYVESGRVRQLAWLAPQRNPREPKVPTLRDLGFPVEVAAPVGLGGPKGMKPEHVKFFEDVFQKILANADIQAFMAQNFQRSDFMSSAAFTDWARKQHPVEADIVKRFNLATNQKP